MTFIPNNSCPGCGSSDIGMINSFNVKQAGNDSLPERYFMLSCRVCGLWFKDQRPTADALKKFYQMLSISKDQWNYELRLPHERKIDEILKTVPTGSNVLDVGCWTGRLLSIHKDLIRYGVEPNPGAAKIARENGIDILAETVTSLSLREIKFDVITLIDVFEHLDNPVQVIDQLISSLALGGKLIIVTGRTDSFPVRLAQSTYWYFSVIPDHIVFLNRKFVDWMRQHFVVTSISAEPLRHYNFSLKKFFWETSWLMVWRYVNPNSPFQKKTWFKHRVFGRFSKWKDIPICTSFRDHYFITIVK